MPLANLFVPCLAGQYEWWDRSCPSGSEQKGLPPLLFCHQKPLETHRLTQERGGRGMNGLAAESPCQRQRPCGQCRHRQQTPGNGQEPDGLGTVPKGNRRPFPPHLLSFFDPGAFWRVLGSTGALRLPVGRTHFLPTGR